jgi:hypothetical protein
MGGFPHIGKHISPFEVIGGKVTLFKAFSTYLEANSLHEEVPSGIIDPLHVFKGKRSETSHMEEPQNMTCGKVNG